MRVAVVDDSVEIAQMLETVLDLAGVEVTVYSHDFRSLFAAEKWEGVDVALVDLMLPEVDGEEILGYLAERHPSIRRFVLSAVAHQREGLDRLATVISKPVAPNVLLGALGVRND